MSHELGLGNVIIAALFLVSASVVSYRLDLGIERTILVSGARCWIQLTIVSYILRDIFEAQNPVLVALMTLILTLLGSFEACFQRSKLGYSGMYYVYLVSLSIPLSIGILGTRFAVASHDEVWWDPVKLIPIMGMLIGNAVSGLSVGTGYILSQTLDNQDKIEMYLSFGASRTEAMRSIVVEAVRLAVLPSINSMSVVGLISIPGMMTGSILGGASVAQAARYQEIILFLMSASNLGGAFLSVYLTTYIICIDGNHKLRTERITKDKANLTWIYGGMSRLWDRIRYRRSGNYMPV